MQETSKSQVSPEKAPEKPGTKLWRHASQRPAAHKFQRLISQGSSAESEASFRRDAPQACAAQKCKESETESRRGASQRGAAQKCNKWIKKLDLGASASVELRPREYKAVPRQVLEPAWDGFPNTPDPLGDIPFALLQDDSPFSLQCHRCRRVLRVHEEAAFAYEGAKNIMFLCRFLTGVPCPGEKPTDKFFPWQRHAQIASEPESVIEAPLQRHTHIGSEPELSVAVPWQRHTHIGSEQEPVIEVE